MTLDDAFRLMAERGDDTPVPKPERPAAKTAPGAPPQSDAAPRPDDAARPVPADEAARPQPTPPPDGWAAAEARRAMAEGDTDVMPPPGAPAPDGDSVPVPSALRNARPGQPTNASTRRLSTELRQLLDFAVTQKPPINTDTTVLAVGDTPSALPLPPIPPAAPGAANAAATGDTDASAQNPQAAVDASDEAVAELLGALDEPAPTASGPDSTELENLPADLLELLGLEAPAPSSQTPAPSDGQPAPAPAPAPPAKTPFDDDAPVEAAIAPSAPADNGSDSDFVEAVVVSEPSPTPSRAEAAPSPVPASDTTQAIDELPGMAPEPHEVPEAAGPVSAEAAAATQPAPSEEFLDASSEADRFAAILGTTAVSPQESRDLVGQFLESVPEVPEPAPVAGGEGIAPMAEDWLDKLLYGPPGGTDILPPLAAAGLPEGAAGGPADGHSPAFRALDTQEINAILKADDPEAETSVEVGPNTAGATDPALADVLPPDDAVDGVAGIFQPAPSGFNPESAAPRAPAPLLVTESDLKKAETEPAIPAALVQEALDKENRRADASHTSVFGAVTRETPETKIESSRQFVPVRPVPAPTVAFKPKDAEDLATLDSYRKAIAHGVPVASPAPAAPDTVDMPPPGDVALPVPPAAASIPPSAIVSPPLPQPAAPRSAASSVAAALPAAPEAVRATHETKETEAPTLLKVSEADLLDTEGGTSSSSAIRRAPPAKSSQSFAMPPPDAMFREMLVRKTGRDAAEAEGGVRLSEFKDDTGWRDAADGSDAAREKDPSHTDDSEPVRPDEAAGLRFNQVRVFPRLGYAPLPPTGRLADSFRQLRGRVLAAASRKPSLLVSGAVRGAGRTEVAIQIALQMARRPDARVCLADLDFRHPSVAVRLGVPVRTFGVGDLLRDACPLEDALVYSAEDNLFVLPARPPSADGDDLLDPANAVRLVERLHKAFEFVVMDCGVALDDAGPELLAGTVGCVALVARPGRDDPSRLRRAAERIARAGGSVAGLVMVGAA